MCKPSCDPSEGEETSEEFRWEAHRLVDQTAVKVDIGVKLAADEEFILQGDLLESHGHVDEGIAPANLEDVIADPTDDFRTRVVVLVDAVPKTHQLSLAILHLPNESIDIVHIADLFEHPQHSLVGAPVPM